MNSKEEDKFQLLAHAESRSSYPSHSLFAEQFTSVPGKYVTIAETIRGF